MDQVLFSVSCIDGRRSAEERLLRHSNRKAPACRAWSEKFRVTARGGTDGSRFPREKSHSAANTMFRTSFQIEPGAVSRKIVGVSSWTENPFSVFIGRRQRIFGEAHIVLPRWKRHYNHHDD